MSDEAKPGPIQRAEVSTEHESPEIDFSKLPALPPGGSKAWLGASSSGRLRFVGCGCGLLILIAAIVTAYLGLRQKVWSSYDEVREGLKHSILTEVGPEEKQRLLDNIANFETMVSEVDDPFPSIGRFVGVGRKALADFVVEPDEAEKLNLMLEEEIAE
jgi:hypothetical protein